MRDVCRPLYQDDTTPVGTHGLCVRCVKAIRVTMIRVTLCRDARSERPSPLNPRCCNFRSTTDAQTERPYSGLHVSSLYVRCVLCIKSIRVTLCRNARLVRPLRPYKGLLVRSAESSSSYSPSLLDRSQGAHSVEHGEDGHAYISEDGHPHGGYPEQCQE